MQTTQTDEFLTTREAAVLTRYASHTLNKLRVQGGGPPFIRLGHKIVYSKTDLLAFMYGNRCASTSTASAVAKVA
jgi:hypothetical protein